MELVEFVPDLMTAIGHSLVLLLAHLCVIFAELLLSWVYHIWCELIEDDILFGSSILIKL